MFSTKEIIRLYNEEKLSTRQIAQKLGCARSLVASRLNAVSGLRSLSESTRLRSTPSYIEKIRESKIGEKNPQSKLTKQQVLDIRTEYEKAIKNGHPKSSTQYLLAEVYGVKRATISDIVLRKTWKHI